MSQYGFLWPIFFRIRTESWILSLYGKMRVRENPYSGIFYVVSLKQVPNFKTMVRVAFNILNTA